jgi:hypothetical protein
LLVGWPVDHTVSSKLLVLAFPFRFGVTEKFSRMHEEQINNVLDYFQVNETDIKKSCGGKA